MVYFILQIIVHYEWSPGRNSRQELGGRDWSRGHGGGGSFLLAFFLKLVQYAFLCNTNTHSYTWIKVKKSFFKRPSKPLKLFFQYLLWWPSLCNYHHCVYWVCEEQVKRSFLVDMSVDHEELCIMMHCKRGVSYIQRCDLNMESLTANDQMASNFGHHRGEWVIFFIWKEHKSLVARGRVVVTGFQNEL